MANVIVIFIFTPLLIFLTILILSLFYGIVIWVFTLFWEECTGNIETKLVEKRPLDPQGFAYEPKLTYKYFVEREYEGNKMFIRDFIPLKLSNYKSEFTAAEILETFPNIGEPITVYYSPRNPSKSVLKRDLDSGIIKQFLTLSAITIFIIIKLLE